MTGPIRKIVEQRVLIATIPGGTIEVRFTIDWSRADAVDRELIDSLVRNMFNLAESIEATLLREGAS
jgi:hypothetical protein